MQPSKLSLLSSAHTHWLVHLSDDSVSVSKEASHGHQRGAQLIYTCGSLIVWRSTNATRKHKILTNLDGLRATLLHSNITGHLERLANLDCIKSLQGIECQIIKMLNQIPEGLQSIRRVRFS